MNEAKDNAKNNDSIKQLMEQKLQLVAQIQDLKSQVAKINIDLQRAGASSSDLICW